MRQKDCFNTLVTHPSLLFFVILSFKAVKESMNKANHPHAVTAIYDKGTPVPSESQMDYDANGNMIRKGNKIFVYDALNRLRTIKDGTKILEQFIYDYQGQRVITKREDNVVTVNIDGLYEINTVPGKEETKTKYIYGIKNEVVTQITDNNSTFLTWYDKGVLEKYYDKDSVSGLLMYGYGYATRIVSSPEYNRAIVKSGVIALILLFGIMTVWVAVKNPKTTQLTRIPTFLKPTVPVLMLAFSVLTMQGCYMFENETVSGTPPWLAYEDAPNNSPQSAEQQQNSDGTGTGSSAEPTMYEAISEYLFGKPEGSGIITSGIPKTGVLFFHPDYTGNTKFVTDSYGNVRSTMRYKPYGEIFNQSGTDNFRHKFNGKDKDHYTGLYYYGARYYDPEIGRWTSPDSIIPHPNNSQAYNRYMFVYGSPVNYQDDGGHIIMIALVVAMVAGAALGGYIGYQQTGTWQGAAAGAVIGAAVGAAIVGVGVGVGALGGSSTAFGGTIGGHLTASWYGGCINTGIALGTGERDPKALGRYFAAGAAGGLLASTGGFGFAGKGVAGKWIAQPLVTGSRYKLNEWAKTGGFSKDNWGLSLWGLNLSYNNSEGMSVGPNYFFFASQGVVAANWTSGGDVTWDWETMSMRGNGGFVGTTIAWLQTKFNSDFVGFSAYSILRYDDTSTNAAGLTNLDHEQNHVWQSRYFENSFDGNIGDFEFALNSWAGYVNNGGSNWYNNNSFEKTAWSW